MTPAATLDNETSVAERERLRRGIIRLRCGNERACHSRGSGRLPTDRSRARRPDYSSKALASCLSVFGRGLSWTEVSYWLVFCPVPFGFSFSLLAGPSSRRGRFSVVTF